MSLVGEEEAEEEGDWETRRAIAGEGAERGLGGPKPSSERSLRLS